MNKHRIQAEEIDAGYIGDAINYIKKLGFNINDFNWKIGVQRSIDRGYIGDSIKHIKQFRFKESSDIIKRLRFDFAILNDDNTIKTLIEYNGLQHYEFIKYFHKEEINFNLSKSRDQLKINFCKENNIFLHIIKYNDDIDKKINEIIINNEIQHSNK